MAESVEQPIVSICIANFNGMAVIDDCIRSVMEQMPSLPMEIIVHDDASTDGSASHIRSRYPQIHVIESEQNVGFCVANNRMAEASTGEYLLLLNNDAALYPDALNALLAKARALQQPAILSLPQYDMASGALIDRGSMLDPFFNPVPNLDARKHDVAMVMGACLWIPSSLWHELGGFPVWMGSIAEDMYLCCRARLTGYRVLALNTSGYKHHVGHSFGGGKVVQGRLKTNKNRRALSERNKTFVMIICSPTPLLLSVLPLHLVLLLLEGLLLSLLNTKHKVWKTIYAPTFTSIALHWRRLLQLRKNIQEQRKVGIRVWLVPVRYFPYKLMMLLKHGVPEFR